MSVDLVGMGLQYIPPKKGYVRIQKQATKINEYLDFRKFLFLNFLSCDKALFQLQDMIYENFINYNKNVFIFYEPCGMLKTHLCSNAELIQLHNLIYFKQERLPKIVMVNELKEFHFRGI